MKVLEEIKVSVYENVYSKKPKVMSFLEVIIMCIHPVYATIINTIRRYYADGDHAAAQKLKNQLPCFTPAGTFNGAHAIKHFLLPSHIVGLDYDHVKNRLEVIQRCAADPHTVAAIESPTDGVKIFAYVEDIEGRHRFGHRGRREGDRPARRHLDRLPLQPRTGRERHLRQWRPGGGTHPHDRSEQLREPRQLDPPGTRKTRADVASVHDHAPLATHRLLHSHEFFAYLADRADATSARWYSPMPK